MHPQVILRHGGRCLLELLRHATHAVGRFARRHHDRIGGRHDNQVLQVQKSNELRVGRDIAAVHIDEEHGVFLQLCDLRRQ